MQVRLGLNNKQISAIESLIKKITPEELKKNEIAINDQFKNLNKSINSAVNDYAGQINTKGKIEKDEANHKAKINAVCGTLLTVLAVAAFIFVGATLALTLPALLAFVGAIFITQGAMILGTAGGLVTWLSKEKERDKGEAKINNIIDTLPDQLNNLSNNLNSIGESIKTCAIDTEKVRIEAKMEDEKGKIKPSATPDTSKSGGISQSK